MKDASILTSSSSVLFDFLNTKPLFQYKLTSWSAQISPSTSTLPVTSNLPVNASEVFLSLSSAILAEVEVNDPEISEAICNELDNIPTGTLCNSL